MTDFVSTDGAWRSPPVARDGAGRRVVERDRHGTRLAALVWAGNGALSAACVRLPDGGWLSIEPGRGAPGPWGGSDRLGRSAVPTTDAGAPPPRPLTDMSALDWAAIDRIPVVAQPARLPPGAGTAVLNLIAALAADQGRASLVYDGPYPTEALFLALLGSFHYDETAADPLAAFAAGRLAWTPDPHERLVTGEGVLVHWRRRIETVHDGARLYVRPDWQRARCHAPRLVRDDGDGVRCSLAALGDVLEDHLTLGADGTLTARPPVVADEAGTSPLPDEVAAGIVTAVAASSAAALREAIEETGRRLTVLWGPVDRDLVADKCERLVLSHRLRRALGHRLRHAPDRRVRVETALAGVAEMAALLGDALRARAQARLAAADAATQARALETVGGGEQDAARIARAARGLLDQLLA